MQGPKPGPTADPADERVFLASEEDVVWDYGDLSQGDTALIRWRTLVPAGRTPTSGISMGVCEIPPGSQLAPHHHRPQEVYYVTAGEAEVFLDGGWRPLHAGDVAYIPGDAVHGLRNRGAALCRIVWVFPTDTWDEIEYIDHEGP